MIPRPASLHLPEGKNFFDAENARLIHQQLGDLTPVVASDPRLWARLTHVECWQYMLARWPVDKNTTAETIRARYFFSGTDSRALLRNGISRLWWYAAITHDPKRKDQYELTDAAFLRLDIAQNLFENSFGRSKQLVHAYLEFVLKHRDRCIDEGETSRQRMRYIASCVNGRTGVGVVDAVSKKQLTEFLEYELDRFDKHSA